MAVPEPPRFLIDRRAQTGFSLAKSGSPVVLQWSLIFSYISNKPKLEKQPQNSKNKPLAKNECDRFINTEAKLDC